MKPEIKLMTPEMLTLCERMVAAIGRLCSAGKYVRAGEVSNAWYAWARVAKPELSI